MLTSILFEYKTFFNIQKAFYASENNYISIFYTLKLN